MYVYMISYDDMIRRITCNRCREQCVLALRSPVHWKNYAYRPVPSWKQNVPSRAVEEKQVPSPPVVKEIVPRYYRPVPSWWFYFPSRPVLTICFYPPVPSWNKKVIVLYRPVPSTKLTTTVPSRPIQPTIIFNILPSRLHFFRRRTCQNTTLPSRPE